MSALVEQKQLIKGGAFLIEERSPDEIFTPEDFTEEHRMIAETTRQFVDNEVTPRIDELERHDWKLARELTKKAADLGLIGANIPEEYGGLGLDIEKVNVNGGAIALGHPLGCTGAKLTASILRELVRRKGRYGMVTMCVGGGMGAAGIFERI